MFILTLPARDAPSCDGPRGGLTCEHVSQAGGYVSRSTRGRVWHARTARAQNGNTGENADISSSFPDTEELLRKVAEMGIDVQDQQMVSQYEQLEMGVDSALTEQVSEASVPEVHVTVLTKTQENVEFVRRSLVKASAPGSSASPKPRSLQSTGWILPLVRCVDPYFGETKGEGPPLYMMLVPAAEERERLKRVLEDLPVPSTGGFDYVPAEYWVVHEECCSVREGTFRLPEFVVSHVITADWTKASNARSLQSVLAEHYSQCVQANTMERFCVYQAVAQPSVFKVLEYFVDQEQVANYMATLDASLGERIMPYRAAVNRVRQMYRVLSLDP